MFDHEEHILWKKNEEWQLFTGTKPLYANMLELVENGVWKSRFGKNPQDGVHGQPEIPKVTWNQQAGIENIHI